MTGQPPTDSTALENLKVSSIANNAISSGILKLMDPAIEKLLGLDKIKKVYSEIQGMEDTELIRVLFEHLNTTIKFKNHELDFIPKKGPVIVVANHPYGGLDGIVLYSLLQKVRPDFKIMANDVLKLITEFKKQFILVDVFNEKAPQNRAAIKEALKHLSKDGLLAVFPAGEVSRYEFGKKKVTDKNWNDSFARLARMSGAQIVPIHFSGRNSLLFQLAGLAHPILRTALLPRQMMKKNRKIQVRVGQPLKQREIKQFSSSEQLSNFIRLKTYLLNEKPRDILKSAKKKKNAKLQEEIAEETDRELLVADIENLEEKNHLLDHKEYSVFYGGIGDFPNLILEIGRLREITFREVGEGSGKKYDLDKFDNTYKHLIVWNNEKNELVGSYRFAPVDEIVANHGIKGLYTSSFYKFSKSFKQKISNGLELGRSFVRREYQKQFVPLMLLWKGICRFILNNPRYHYLFGAVSISSNYDEKSRYLISNLLISKNSEVKARKKYACRLKSDPDVSEVCKKLELDTLDLLSNLIKTVEGDKDVPILLKQYMKLGGQLHSFTVDDSFGDCLDGLIVVDLKESPKKTLKLYMDDHIDEYREYHGL